MTEDSSAGWNTKSGSFVKRPGKGWLHADEKMQEEGITYNVKYVGMIPVNESMKSLNFETRTIVARESIRRVVEAARNTILPRRNKKNDDNMGRILNSKPDLTNSGTNIALHINIQYLKVTAIEMNEGLYTHLMQNISFACGGDADIQDYVAYVAKDESCRACYVFECPNGLANHVITTIGQAFELRFKKFLNSFPNNNNPNSNGQSKGLGSQAIGTPQPSSAKENFNSNNSSPPTEIISSARKPNPNNPLENHHHNLNVKDSNSPLSDHRGAGKLDDNLANMPWFHGILTRETAENMLKKDGDYLVRISNRADKQYVLSGRYQGECRHIFLVDPAGVVRTKDRVFDNICHLIKYHQDNNIPIVSKDNELLLEHPISRYN